jgi:hypothetical protein
LKVTAAEQRRDVQDMLAEALNLIFAKIRQARDCAEEAMKPADAPNLALKYYVY